MTIQRMDHVGIIVDDLAAAIEFFVALVQVPANGVPAVPLADHVAQPVRLAQPGARAGCAWPG